jgi:DNA primase
MEMKLFEAAKSVDLLSVLTDMCGVVVPQRRRNTLMSCPICGAGTNTPCFGLYGKTKNILDKYKCFSCGSQGDSIAFVKNYYGFATDVDAAKEICTHFNIEYEDSTSQPNQEYLDYTKTYNYVAKLFAFCYKSGVNPNPKYFEDRGLSKEVIDEYKLGYCPSVFVTDEGKHISLKDILIQLNLPLVDGLYNSYGECVFSDRYIFPITNTKGDVIAFSGRSLDPNLPKYINSCETPFFKKSYALFNYHKAKSYPSVYVVEGYMDALSLVTCGIPNVVAAMGTAFTSSHISTLSGKNIILSLDHDGAGLKHTLSIIEQHKDIYFRVVYTPQEYKDFNEMLIARADIKTYLSEFKPKTGPEFMIRYLTYASDMSNLEVRSDIWRRLASLIGSTNPAYQAQYPLNTLYTPVEIWFFWKIFSKFISKNRKEVK